MTAQHSSEDTSPADEAAPERAFRRHKVGEALATAGFGEVLVLSHEAADRALTPARREIIETLAQADVASLRELADELDRNPGNLSRDLKVLVAENVIQYEQSGKAKCPTLKHETIIVEPLVASADPLPDSVFAT